MLMQQTSYLLSTQAAADYNLAAVAGCDLEAAVRDVYGKVTQLTQASNRATRRFEGTVTSVAPS